MVFLIISEQVNFFPVTYFQLKESTNYHSTHSSKPNKSELNRNISLSEREKKKWPILHTPGLLII